MTEQSDRPAPPSPPSHQAPFELDVSGIQPPQGHLARRTSLCTAAELCPAVGRNQGAHGLTQAAIGTYVHSLSLTAPLAKSSHALQASQDRGFSPVVPDTA